MSTCLRGRGPAPDLSDARVALPGLGRSSSSVLYCFVVDEESVFGMVERLGLAVRGAAKHSQDWPSKVYTNNFGWGALAQMGRRSRSVMSSASAAAYSVPNVGFATPRSSRCQCSVLIPAIPLTSSCVSPSRSRRVLIASARAPERSAPRGMCRDVFFVGTPDTFRLQHHVHHDIYAGLASKCLR